MIKKLQEELDKYQRLFEEAVTAEKNVRELLVKADAKANQPDVKDNSKNERHWNKIVENLEKALDHARAGVTAYAQHVKKLEQQIANLRETGQLPPSEEALNEAAALEVEIVKGMEAAERILAMSLDQLSFLTLDEVSVMHEQLIEESGGQQEQSAAARAAEPPAKKTILQERIERAQEARRHIASSAKPPAPTIVERRKQMVLREAVRKVIERDVKGLNLEEAEAAIEHYQKIITRPLPGENDLRLKRFFDVCINEINERAADLRRKQVQKYLR